jgi:hypothetical protein
VKDKINRTVHAKGFTNILFQKLEAGVTRQMLNVAAVACNEVVQRKDLMAAFHDAITYV